MKDRPVLVAQRAARSIGYEHATRHARLLTEQCQEPSSERAGASQNLHCHEKGVSPCDMMPMPVGNCKSISNPLSPVVLCKLVCCFKLRACRALVLTSRLLTTRYIDRRANLCSASWPGSNASAAESCEADLGQCSGCSNCFPFALFVAEIIFCLERLEL